MRFVGFFLELPCCTHVHMCVKFLSVVKPNFWFPFIMFQSGTIPCGRVTFVHISLSASPLELCIRLQPTILAVEEERKELHHLEVSYSPNSQSSIPGPSQELPKQLLFPKCFSYFYSYHDQRRMSYQ